ncbi:MAG TPA: hypothetical protein VK054_09945, partial [Beutenbergiaceae bacterium]|nr:hypothetical protein [Beutenbergiaceae bacterium]
MDTTSFICDSLEFWTYTSAEHVSTNGEFMNLRVPLDESRVNVTECTSNLIEVRFLDSAPAGGFNVVTFNADLIDTDTTRIFWLSAMHTNGAGWVTGKSRSFSSGEGEGDEAIPGIELRKFSTSDGRNAGHYPSAPGKALQAGNEAISFEISNTGTTNLSQIALSDIAASGPQIVLGDECAALSTMVLEPGEDFTCQGTLAATPGVQEYASTATVTALSPRGVEVSATDTWHGILPNADLPLAGIAINVEQPVCVVPGEPLSTPSLTVQGFEGLNITHTDNVAAGETVIITATAEPGFDLIPADGWTIADDGASATYEVTLDNPDCEATPVTLIQPEITQAVCVAPGEDLQAPTVVPVETDGATYEVTDNVAAGETVIITATAEPGFDLIPADGWTIADDGASATYEVTLDEIACDEEINTGEGETSSGAGELEVTGLAHAALFATGALTLITAGVIIRRRVNA